MQKITVAHFGSFDICANRYIDIFESQEISSIKIFIEDDKYYQVEDIYHGIKLYEAPQVAEKLHVYVFSLTIIEKVVMRFSSFFGPNIFPVFRPLLFLGLKKLVKKHLLQGDVVWLGENDYDNHNLIHSALEKEFRPHHVVKSYKETRFTQKFFEKKSLELSDSIIFPNRGYVSFFERLYGNELFGLARLLFADHDHRSNHHRDLLRRFDATKNRDSDGLIHIAVVVGQAACEPCARSGDRYVIVQSIMELLDRGFFVHLFAKAVIKSRTEPIEVNKSIYHELEKKNSRFRMSFEPMNVGSRIYEDIVKCDYGYLHDDVDMSNVGLFEFQKINIPNRYYEYLIAGLVPVAISRESESYQNKLVRDCGVLVSDYSELHDLQAPPSPGPYYNKFATVFLEAIKSE